MPDHLLTRSDLAAAKLMGLARTNAGVGWNDNDAAMLAEYRAGAGTE